ncbi:sugar phosphate isomerase/epimerase [Methanomicrobium sp. W14]|uniref:sugar phosphate isomerase/epimerase family protein n=1 Tax=Methanomicrobium sp. W14 TaxID=2817839 RepID=UPI001AE18DF2|nr:sugar phosphate isomerase/epimerase family protein [Methanomicrobium sp. W14]MBP2132853.1 sugar phosphate isomerase/epimerase [Methanomicrobium sp. W14]
MPKYSVSSMFFHEYTIEKIFDFVSEAGCSSIEFWFETPDFWINGLPVEKLNEIQEKHPSLLPITVHSPVLDLNPCSINPGISEISVKTTLNAIKIAEEVNAHVITVHPGRRTAKRTPGEMDIERLYRYLGRIEKSFSGCRTKIAIENMEPKINSILSTPDFAYELLKKEPWLYFTLDTAHAVRASEKDALQYIDLLHDRIQNVHVSGADESMTHILPHKDKRIEKILKYLKDFGYDGHLTLEIEDLNFKGNLGSYEKIKIISKEIKFLKYIFGE